MPNKQENLNEIIHKFNHLADIKFKVFEVLLKEHLERNQERSRKVSVTVIGSSFDRVNHLVKTIDFSGRNKTNVPHRIKQQIFYPEKPSVLFCDLDGTLCLTNILFRT